MADADDLLARLRTADPAAVAEFAELRRPQLAAYVERQLGAALRAKFEIDDVVQETLLRAVRYPQLFAEADRDPFGALCHLAQEAIVDLHRKWIDAQKRAAGREVPLQAGAADSTSGGGLIDLLAASLTSASAVFSRDQRELRMHAALDALPEKQRTALRLRYVDGLPTKEIAERLHKTDGAVRVMLTRSLDKLQQLLGES